MHKKEFFPGFVGLFILIQSLFVLNCFAQKETGDFYSDIANTKYQNRNSFPMERPAPVLLDKDKKLDWDKRHGRAFTPMTKIVTEKQMKVAMAGLRDKYSAYLQDIAPKAVNARKRLDFSAMQFRYETANDQNDFNYTLSGKGEWENINIPYYHGPQGPSTAYYRTEFSVDSSMLGDNELFLHFNGADYYTDAYINGHHVGYHQGMLDEFEFNVRKYIHQGNNILLIRLRNDFSMLGSEMHTRRWGNKLAASNSPGWDDPYTGWNCCPAGYGLYQDLYLETRSKTYIADIFARPDLATSSVDLWVETEMINGYDANEFELSVSLFGQNFEAEIVKKLKKNIQQVGGRVLTKITIKIPEDKLRLWNPDSPWLYQMQVSLLDQKGIKQLDNKKCQFGMRSFVISSTSTPKGRMYLNGKEVRLRGTNTMGFLQLDVMRKDWDQLTDDILMAKLTNMNFIRTTQRIMPKEVYEYADRLGMMMQADLPLFAYINQKQFHEVLAQAPRIERVLRNHPSVIMMTYLNESMGNMKPHAISRTAYERMFDALDIVVRHENPDRAVKYVDGDYDSPNKGLPDDHCYNIWYPEHGTSLPLMMRGAWEHVKTGWMYGCGEFGAEGLDYPAMMRRRYPKNWNEREDGSWSPKQLTTAHSTNQTFGKYPFWFEAGKNMEEWVKASQEHQRWGVDKVTRAFRRMSRMNTFAIHLFIDAWPNGWMKAIVDCERRPKAAWYSFRDALTPLSVQIRSERNSFYSGEKYPVELWICNDTHNTPNSELRYQLELNGRVIKTGKVAADIPTVKDGSRFQGFLDISAPKVKKRSKLTLRLGLFDLKSGKQLHEHTLDASVFPKIGLPKNNRIYVVGNIDSISVPKELGAKNIVIRGDVKSTDVIIIEKYEMYNARREEINRAVQNGAHCLLMEIPEGKAEVGTNGDSDNVVQVLTEQETWSLNHNITIHESKSNWSWIVARNIRHPWLKGTRAGDFKYLYNSKTKSPVRQTFGTFKAKEFTPVMIYKDDIIIGDKKEGKGRWVISLLDVKNQLDCNPALAELFVKMLFK